MSRGPWCVRFEFIKFLHQVRCSDSLGIFPAVMCRGIAMPMNFVLELPPMESGIEYHLYFPLRFSFYYVQGWFLMVRSMFGCLLIGG